MRLGGRGGLDGKYTRMQRKAAIDIHNSKNMYCVTWEEIGFAKLCIVSDAEELLIVYCGALLLTIAGPTANAIAVP